MERLEIRNFLTIKEADIDVKRFTVLIGPQASGKSVVAKLLYFFREFLNKQVIRSIQNNETKRELQKAGLKRFEEFFSAYAWENQVFFIKYQYKEIQILIDKKTAGKRAGLIIEISENLQEFYSQARSGFLKMRKRAVLEQVNEVKVFWQFRRENIDSSPLGDIFGLSVFVPANRSFFANLQKNIFSLLANSIAIDPLIKEFGSTYEIGKFEHGESNGKALCSKLVYDCMEKIIVGEYILDKEGDWILSGRGRVNLAHASSGQQEALPMLLVLFLPINNKYLSGKKPTYFIEEPEAHLFPVAQRYVVELLSYFYNRESYNYFITTHSPYILTALNNLIYAGNLAQQESLREQVKEIVPEEIQVSFDDVSAYVMENGGIKSILDPELKIIGASVIDEVSNDFDAVFSKLLELEAVHG